MSSKGKAKRSRSVVSSDSWTSKVESIDEQSRVDYLQQALDESAAEARKSGNGGPSEVPPANNVLASPPSSPHSLGPAPSSPRAKARDEYFKRRKYEELIRGDNGFREMLDDVDGMRTWWTRNKQDWHQKKLSLERTEAALASLQDRALYEEDFHDERQIQHQTQRQKEKLAWFEENRSLMRIVWDRFKVFNEVEMLADGPIDPPIPAGRAVNPARPVVPALSPGPARRADPEAPAVTPYAVSNSPRFNPIFNSTSPHTNTRFEYRSSRNPANSQRWLSSLEEAFWWLERAKEDVASHTKRLKTLIETFPGEKARFIGLAQTLETQLDGVDTNDADDRVDTAIKKLMDDRPVDFKEQIQTAIMNRRREKLVLTDGQDRRALEVYKTKSIELDVILKILEQQDGIVDTLVDLLNTTLMEVAKYDLDQRNKDAFVNIHNICYLYSERRRLSLVIRSTLADAQLSVTTKRNIVNRINQYISDHNVEDLPMTENGRYRSKHIKIYFDQMFAANAAFNILADDISDITRRATRPEAQDYRQSKLDDASLLLQRPIKTSVLTNNIFGFASNMTLASAKAMLEERKPGRKMNGTILQELFTSPDIFPLFHPDYIVSSWTKPQFYDLINSKLAKKLTNELLEAFLIYCTHTGELFRVTYFGQRV
ncbi:uncharacterized protein LY89DRAFT_719196 [Mollisia scopiformis]|uniref:Uncharacterized protein n=1 Tax=Mollisia scopiformis TaxID=149040 RepID=A0A194X9N6_MOLSC|nr:uncharacterized protein LY89DRAFT_719196 [Mollisia scopiformis]KUJ16482.1 hypothetical protein LY89DRAFT_719196 [Mollisia scopiformis]